jgi:hypothetical protein
MPPMKRASHRRPVFAALVAIGAIATGGQVALAVTPADPSSTPDDAEVTPIGADDAGSEIDVATAAPGPYVSLSGGANGEIAAVGEARTTWRYGRTKAGATLDEATSRVRVSGAGRTFDGLTLTFSVAVLVPALRLGTYDGGGSLGVVAGAWARRDLGNAAPDIEWDATARDGGPANFVLTVTWLAETDHTSDRRGSITSDVTEYRAHGTLEATLPCTRAVRSLRQSCQTETIRGTF